MVWHITFFFLFVFLLCIGSEDLCIAMDGSQRSYQLLGNFASGKHLYELHRTDEELFIVFIASEMADPLKVKVPSLTMTGDDLLKL